MSTNVAKTDRSCSVRARTSLANSSSKETNVCLSLKNDAIVGSKECLKKYVSLENDYLSIKDYSFNEHGDSKIATSKDSITNSDLDKLEADIMNKLSVKFRENHATVANVDSVLEVLKTNVQNIFNSFDENMHDFDVFKHKFNEIIERYRGDTIKEMEHFVREMLEHMSSSEFNDKNAPLQVTNESNDLNNDEYKFNSFNNLNFTTVTTPEDEESFRVKTDSFNTFVVSNHIIEKALSGRNLLSEVNIRKKIVDALDTLASTENLKKLAAKKLEIDNYSQEQVAISYKDIDIPVKSSCAKKDLYLNKDFDRTKNEEEKFFIFKICSYLCKKIRRNPFA